MPALEPIVARLGLSPEQAAAVTARGCAVAVTAGAGTGKTRTLVARYLSLLAEGLPSRRVVAITFTRKAAREMRNRAREQVRRYLEDPSLGEDEREHWQGIYRQLDAARIGTIHSLCGEILRHHPAQTGLDPRFEVLKEGQAALLQAEAVDAALSWAADDPQGAELYALFGEQALERTLSQLLAARLDAEEAFAALPEDAGALRAYWGAAVVGAHREAIDALFGDPGYQDAVSLLRAAEARTTEDRLVAQVQEVLAAVDAAVEAMGKQAPTQPFESLRAGSAPMGEGPQFSPHRGELEGGGRLAPTQPFESLGADSAPRGEERVAFTQPATLTGIYDPMGEEIAAQALAALGEIKLNVGSQRAWRGGKEELARVKAALKMLRAAWGQAAPWATLALTEVDEALIGCYPALHALYRHASERYAELKGRQAALDFDDLEAGALRLLCEHPAVRAYWQAEIGALLVDEFQDTNARQRDLLDLLDAGAAKLFLVGDGKQSIYRFRGADVTVFRQKRAQVEAEGQAYDLAVSYRAHRQLIAALNALLAPVLGVADAARPYVEPFSPLVHHRQAPAEGLADAFAYVELHLALGSKSDGALDRAAVALVARLVDLIENGEVYVSESDPDEGRTVLRPLDYGDVAILCRASSAFPAYEDALEAAGVPFLTVAGRGFYDRPEVRDVLNALQAIADPTDDLAMVGLLRSAVCRLTDMALYRLVEARRAQEMPSLWALLQQGDLSFLEEEAARAHQAVQWIGQLHAQVGRVPVADVLAAYLNRTDYRAALLQTGQGRAARNVAKLLADAHRSEMVGASAFLEYVAQLRDVGAREGEAHSVGAGAVQVMTVHAAKGLEFPVVVIGDANRRDPATRGLLVDPRFGVLPELSQEAAGGGEPGRPAETIRSAVYQLAQRSAQDQEQAESDRLLYVAATRARELLLISAAVGRSGPDGWLRRLDQALPLSEWLAEDGGAEPALCAATLDADGTGIACTLYPQEAPLADTCAAAFPLPPLYLADDLPLLRSLDPEPIVVDQEATAAQRDPPRRVWRVVPERERPRAPSWTVGQIVHRALERWAFPGQGDGFEALAQAEARRCGIADQAEIQDAVGRAARMLVRFRTTGLCAKMHGAAVRWHEVPYSRLDEQGCLEQGVIDALYRDQEGWVLVEFKTDRIQDRGELAVKLATADYVPQITRYLAAVEAQLGVRPRPALCLLDFRGTVHVVMDCC
jgi:ATP-dependent helicase/nuclease subunit A